MAHKKISKTTLMTFKTNIYFLRYRGSLKNNFFIGFLNLYFFVNLWKAEAKTDVRRQNSYQTPLSVGFGRWDLYGFDYQMLLKDFKIYMHIFFTCGSPEIFVFTWRTFKDNFLGLPLPLVYFAWTHLGFFYFL